MAASDVHNAEVDKVWPTLSTNEHVVWTHFEELNVDIEGRQTIAGIQLGDILRQIQLVRVRQGTSRVFETPDRHIEGGSTKI